MAYIPDEAVEQMYELSAGAWRLYCCLARFLNHKTGQCNPSVATCAEILQVHPKHIFKLRSELSVTGWAKFSGDTVVSLAFFGSRKNATAFGTNEGLALDGSKNATPFPSGSNIATTSSKNATSESQKDYQVVAKMLPDGSKNATPYKEELLNEQLNLTSKGEPTRERAPDPSSESSGLEPLIAILADHYKLYVEPNRRWYEKAAQAVLARHQGEAAAERLSAFLRAKPGQKLTFFATDFASWDAGTAKLRAAAGVGSYSPDFDIAPGTECLDGLTEDELEVLRAKVLSSPTCIRFDQWEPDKAEAYIRIEMAAIAKQETVNA